LGRVVRPSTDIGNRPIVPEDTPPTKQVLELHKNLYKAESALLVQARTKRIGLAEFPYNRRVLVSQLQSADAVLDTRPLDI
jgi:hypothetical protein